MLRMLALPFTILLGVVAFFLLMGGVAILEETGDGQERRDRGLFEVFRDAEAEREAARDGMAVGLTLVVVGLLGMIAAVALTVAALSGGRSEPAPLPQQQQQQVVVVTDGDARVRSG